MEEELNDFFANESDLYRKELLGKTYCFVTNTMPYRIVGMFTISNDSIKTTHLANSATNRLNRGIVNAKRGRSYPAVLIGRLGVNKDFQGEGRFVGTQILDILTSSLRTPKIFIKELGDFLMSCHQHCLGVNLLVQR